MAKASVFHTCLPKHSRRYEQEPSALGIMEESSDQMQASFTHRKAASVESMSH